MARSLHIPDKIIIKLYQCIAPATKRLKETSTASTYIPTGWGGLKLMYIQSANNSIHITWRRTNDLFLATYHRHTTLHGHVTEKQLDAEKNAADENWINKPAVWTDEILLIRPFTREIKRKTSKKYHQCMRSALSDVQGYCSIVSLSSVHAEKKIYGQNSTQNADVSFRNVYGFCRNRWIFCICNRNNAECCIACKRYERYDIRPMCTFAHAQMQW